MYGYPGGASSSTRERRKPKETNLFESRSGPLENGSSSRRRRRGHRGKPRGLTRGAQAGEASSGSFETSSTGTHSNSGVPLSDSDMASTSFAVRAKQAGIPDWNEKVEKGLVGNNSVFDGRWVLNPDEAWNVPVRKKSTLIISPRTQRSGRSVMSSATEDSNSPPKFRLLKVEKQPSEETILPLQDQSTSKFKADLADFGRMHIDDQDLQSNSRSADNIGRPSEDFPFLMETR